MNNSRPVYSTDGGRLPDKKPPKPSKQPPPSKPALPDDGVVRIFREKGGRGGKTVTVVRGLPDRGPALDARAAELRRLCGAGGTVRDGAIEVQGDHRDKVAEKLSSQGFTVKLAGG